MNGNKKYSSTESEEIGRKVENKWMHGLEKRGKERVIVLRGFQLLQRAGMKLKTPK